MNRLFVFFILHFSLFICAASAQNAASAPNPTPYGNGETLLYTVTYRANLIPPINMMRVSLRTVEEDSAGTRRYHVIGNGKTTGGISGIFSLDDTYHLWIDAATLLPLRMSSDVHENDYFYKATYNYNWDAMTVSNVRRNAKWESDRYATIPLKENSGDAVALFFRMRSLDTQNLSQGDTWPLELVLNVDSRPISFKYTGRENIKIRKFGTFRALKFTCTMVTADGSTFEEGMTFTVWVSDDTNRIPLMVDCPIRVGRVRVTLAEGSNVVHPMTSLVK